MDNRMDSGSSAVPIANPKEVGHMCIDHERREWTIRIHQGPQFYPVGPSLSEIMDHAEITLPLEDRAKP
jgi:hypothetical protein